MELPALGLIGTGKVGSTLARLWPSRLVAISNRTPARAQRLASEMGVPAVPMEDVVIAADLVVLAVSDRAIPDVVQTLTGCRWAQKGVIHTSGVHTRDSLRLLAERGAMTGSLHPAYPFAGDTTPDALHGITFALEAEDAALHGWLSALVEMVSGRALWLSPTQKALYHAALVIASNYTVTLYAIAESLLKDLGADMPAATLNALVGATVENLRVKGIPNALTGPLVRADTGTLTLHLDALRQADPALADLYRQLARLSYPMLAARGVAVEQIETALKPTIAPDTAN